MSAGTRGSRTTRRATKSGCRTDVERPTELVALLPVDELVAVVAPHDDGDVGSDPGRRSSSWLFIRKPPSPQSATTLRSGGPAGGDLDADPIGGEPFEMITVFGSYAGRAGRPTLWAPTSDTTMSQLERGRSAIACWASPAASSGSGTPRELLQQRGPEVGMDEGLARRVALPASRPLMPRG
jgi:hypothetical protein